MDSVLRNKLCNGSPTLILNLRSNRSLQSGLISNQAYANLNSTINLSRFSQVSMHNLAQINQASFSNQSQTSMDLTCSQLAASRYSTNNQELANPSSFSSRLEAKWDTIRWQLNSNQIRYIRSNKRSSSSLISNQNLVHRCNNLSESSIWTNRTSKSHLRAHQYFSPSQTSISRYNQTLSGANSQRCQVNGVSLFISNLRLPSIFSHSSKCLIIGDSLFRHRDLLTNRKNKWITATSLSHFLKTY
jgi:hypothetical protein